MGAEVLTGADTELSAKDEDMGAFDVSSLWEGTCVMIGFAEDSAKDDVSCASDEQDTASMVISMIDKRQNNNLHFMRYQSRRERMFSLGMAPTACLATFPSFITISVGML